MGAVGNRSRDVLSRPSGSRVRSTRAPEENAANKSKRRRRGSSPATAVAAPASSGEPWLITEFATVWQALGYSGEEAANLTARMELMMQIESIVESNGRTQAAAAEKCGISQPRMNDLLRHRVDKFSMDALVNRAPALGRRIDFELLAA